MSRSILLLNCGSSSLKYKVLDAETEETLASGICQRVGDAMGTIDHKVNGEKHHLDIQLPDHKVALAEVMKMFDAHGPSLTDVYAVGHRTVHGGTKFREPVLVDESVIQTMTELIPLAPLHNPACIAGIEAGKQVLPDVPHVAIFDTAFFADLPEAAYTYAIPTELAAKHGIRRYGFHGTSHDYVSHEVAKMLGKPYEECNIIVCHLGNGASISAIKQGKPVETSMGMTPLEGLIMGTRSGDIDPGLFAFLAREENMSVEEIDTMLNKKSGIFGLTGALDMREVETKALAEDDDALRGMAIYNRRIVKYVGAYSAVLGTVDAIAFTAGIGEHGPINREGVIDYLQDWGIDLDHELNWSGKGQRVISTPKSKVTVMVVPTDEELQMARQVGELLAQHN